MTRSRRQPPRSPSTGSSRSARERPNGPFIAKFYHPDLGSFRGDGPTLEAAMRDLAGKVKP